MLKSKVTAGMQVEVRTGDENGSRLPKALEVRQTVSKYLYVCSEKTKTTADYVSPPTKSLALVEDHLAQLEEHSAKQVRLLQQEQHVLEHASDFVSPTSNGLDDGKLLKIQADVKRLQQDMFDLQKNHDDFIKETYDMFSEISLLTCEAVENCFGRRA